MPDSSLLIVWTARLPKTEALALKDRLRSQPETISVQAIDIDREVDDHPVIQFGPIQLAPETKTVTCGGDPLVLTACEYRVFESLLRHPNLIVSREELRRAARPGRTKISERAVDVCIHRLRHKLTLHGVANTFIHAVRGFGYTLSGDQDSSLADGCH